jgi:8-oxo-dGTP pyrophosphatase MutT (NUDIX family)
MPDTSVHVLQAAAIPVKAGAVCVVTARSGQRWVIPKGMIDPGHTAAETALREAWEEAGLAGVLLPKPVGTYLYEKWERTHHVTVFLLRVTDAAEDWPEHSFRQRCWLKPAEVLARIDDPGLREVIRAALKQHAEVLRG